MRLMWRTAQVPSHTDMTKRSAFILVKLQCSAFRWDSVEEVVARPEEVAQAVQPAAREEGRVDAERQQIRTWCKAVCMLRRNRGSRRALRANANFILIPMCAHIRRHPFLRKR